MLDDSWRWEEVVIVRYGLQVWKWWWIRRRKDDGEEGRWWQWWGDDDDELRENKNFFKKYFIIIIIYFKIYTKHINRNGNGGKWDITHCEYDTVYVSQVIKQTPPESMRRSNFLNSSWTPLVVYK